MILCQRTDMSLPFVSESCELWGGFPIKIDRTWILIRASMRNLGQNRLCEHNLIASCDCFNKIYFLHVYMTFWNLTCMSEADPQISTTNLQRYKLQICGRNPRVITDFALSHSINLILSFPCRMHASYFHRIFFLWPSMEIFHCMSLGLRKPRSCAFSPDLK